jgi:hypothetical protein
MVVQPESNTFTLLALGLFASAVGLFAWRPDGRLFRVLHFLLWGLVFMGALVGVVFSLFTLFWPPTKHWALVWSCGALVALFMTAVSRGAPSFTEWFS